MSRALDEDFERAKAALKKSPRSRRLSKKELAQMHEETLAMEDGRSPGVPLDRVLREDLLD